MGTLSFGTCRKVVTPRSLPLPQMLTVPEAARRADRDPETIRRWIRNGRLHARKLGARHAIDEADLDALLDDGGCLPLPDAWKRTRSGRPMPNPVAAIADGRRGH